jgi:hypothetical protein
MDDGKGRSVGDRQRRIRGRSRKAPPCAPGLLLAERSQRRFHRTLKTFLDDELGLAVAK